MLVLSRKHDEAITIGENITIRVLSVKRGRVKLGIEVPDDMRVSRSEIDQELRRSEEQKV